MSLTLSFGDDSNNNFDIGSLADLSSTSGSSLPTLLNLTAAVVNSLNQPLTAFPAAQSPIQLNYQSGNPAWTLGDFTFGLGGGVVGSITILPPNSTLFTYTQSFPTTMGAGLNTVTNSNSTGNVAGPDVNYAVGIELDLTLTASLSATVPIGATGIQATTTDNASATYKVIFYKSVPGATTLRQALTLAFQGFVLPLHSMTFSRLQPGDYLYHNFNATLNLGFGVSYGINKVFVSGQSAPSLPATIDSTPVVNASGQVGIQANVGFTTGFQYTGSFETMLWRDAAGLGHLHLYHSKVLDKTFQAIASAALITNPQVNVDPNIIGNVITTVLPGYIVPTAQQALTNSTPLQEITKAINDIDSTLTSWLKPLQNIKTQLELTIDDLQSTYILLDVTCDTTQVGFQTAWNRIVQGDFQAALQQDKNGLSLDAGSGLEYFHHQKTDLCFNLFGKFTADWTTASIANYSILYAGTNTLKMIANIGVESITNVNNSGKAVDFYFAAQATQLTNGPLQLGPPELHIVLTATSNPKFLAEIVGLLKMATAGPIAAQLVPLVSSSLANKIPIQTLELVFESTAYGLLQSSTITHNGIQNEAADKNNYNEFALAARNLSPNLGNVSGFSVQNKLDLNYTIWSQWNETGNGDDPNDQASFPKRRSSGAVMGNQQAYLDEVFNSPTTLNMIGFVLTAASNFMNLCEDLKTLATITPANVDGSWKTFCADLGGIIHNDLPVNYLVPTAYALTELVFNPSVNPTATVTLTGPCQTAATQPSIAVSLRYAVPA